MASHAEVGEVIVVVHTHWDREWYLPFQRFRFRLVQLLDQVLEMLSRHPDFVFLLDGQTAIVDDYLEIRPERERELRRFVQEGRLLIGPWYTQPDEFLVSGEALVRNLLWGIRRAEALGGAMREGYVPDLFGHIAQLPQIFRGFGIESAFLARGADETPKKSEFWWEGLDGSRLWVHRFPAGYDNAPNLDNFPALDALLQRLQEVATTPVILLMHGGDHRAPQRNLPERLQALQARWPKVRFTLGTLRVYRERVLARAPQLERVHGELRGHRWAPILSGVLSARVPLKQQNDRVQTLLERYAEPLASWAWVLGHPYPQGFLREAWRLLLQNHAHDSICGCSVDETHQDVEARFRQALQIAEEVASDSLCRIVGNPPLQARPKGQESQTEVAVIVYNPCPRPRRDLVTVAVPLPTAAGAEAVDVEVVDPLGRPLPAAPSDGEAELTPTDVLQGVRLEPRVRVKFQAELPPLGIQRYTLRLAPSSRSGRPSGSSSEEGVHLSPSPQGPVLENELLRLIVHSDGTFTLEDKRTGRRYERWHFFVDEADRGDEYTYEPLPDDRPRLSAEEAQVRVKPGAVYRDWGTVYVEIEWPLPIGLTSDRKARSSQTAPLRLRTEMTLQRGLPRVDLRTWVENTICDHRLRVGFPCEARARAWAGTAFGAVERAPRAPVPDPPPGWAEAPSPSQPFLRFVAVEPLQGGGFALLARGLYEYELDPHGTLYLTLLRSVGWLSRSDLRQRPGDAGPPLPTPGAQVLGAHVFEYALYPYIDNRERRNVPLMAEEFACPPWGLALPQAAVRQDLQDGSLFTLEGKALMISAVKRAEDPASDGLIVRLYNPTGEEVHGRLRIGGGLPPLREVKRMTLEEAPQEEMPLQDKRTLEIYLRPFQILTLQLSFDSVKRGK